LLFCLFCFRSEILIGGRYVVSFCFESLQMYVCVSCMCMRVFRIRGPSVYFAHVGYKPVF
jgi:hypothetical protein